MPGQDPPRLLAPGTGGCPCPAPRSGGRPRRAASTAPANAPDIPPPLPPRAGPGASSPPKLRVNLYRDPPPP